MGVTSNFMGMVARSWPSGGDGMVKGVGLMVAPWCRRVLCALVRCCGRACSRSAFTPCRCSGLGRGQAGTDGVGQVAGQQELGYLGEAPPVAVVGEGPDHVKPVGRPVVGWEWVH